VQNGQRNNTAGGCFFGMLCLAANAAKHNIPKKHPPAVLLPDSLYWFVAEEAREGFSAQEEEDQQASKEAAQVCPIIYTV
jgi:hypothetical protein